MANVLLVEPDRLLAKTYFQALSEAGHDVIVAAGAQTAIFAADKQLPDVVVLELQLVEHSGIEFLYEFRSYPEWQGIPVIIFSQVPPAEFGPSRGLLQKHLGVHVYHYKPQTSLSRLLAAVNDCLPTAA